MMSVVMTLLVYGVFTEHLSSNVPWFLNQGSLTEGNAQYGWPPCTNPFRSAPFYIENIINLFYKTSYLTQCHIFISISMLRIIILV